MGRHFEKNHVICNVCKNTKVKKEDEHMKMMKKIATMLLAVCLVVPCFSIMALAANGKVMFTDPTTKVGETLELKGVLEADAEIEDRTVVIKYDSTMLKFDKGENITESANGELTYKVTGQKSGKRVEFLIYFEVLKEGQTKVEAKSAEGFTTTNQKITWTSLGNSTIVIEAGQGNNEPTEQTNEDVPLDSSEKVDINGVEYTFSNNIPKEEIPEGFTSGILEYNGKDFRIVEQETTGIKLGYMLNSEDEGRLFMYVEENAVFVPFVQVEINSKNTITLLSDLGNNTLAEPYVESTYTYKGDEFPVWQNEEKPQYCVFYVINSLGEKLLYQYDIEEDTFQRFDVPTQPEEVQDDSLVGKLKESMGDHLDYVIIAGGVGFILFLVIIIVLAIKLYNRNAELDELYDEYGIGLDDEEDGKEDDDEMLISYDDDDDDTYGDNYDDDDFVFIDDDDEDDEFEELVIEQEKPVEPIVFETEDDVLLEQKMDESLEEKDEAEWDFELLINDVEDDDDLSVADDDEDFFDDDDSDFHIDFIDLDE